MYMYIHIYTYIPNTPGTWTQGFRFDPVPELLKGSDAQWLRQRRFNTIFATRFWHPTAESRSGPGSGSDDVTVGTRDVLVEVLRTLQVGSMLDVGCGDWNWMKLLDLSGPFLCLCFLFVCLSLNCLCLYVSGVFASDVACGNSFEISLREFIHLLDVCGVCVAVFVSVSVSVYLWLSVCRSVCLSVYLSV